MLNNPHTDFKIGDKREITIEYTIHVIVELMRAGNTIYEKIKEKIKT